MNKLFAQLVEKRHHTDDFLHPKYENLTDPFILPDMDKAVTRLKKAKENHEKIRSHHSCLPDPGLFGDHLHEYPPYQPDHDESG